MSPQLSHPTSVRRIVVTGSARGIGFAVAEALIANGNHVALVDINSEKVNDAASRLGPNAIALTADLTNEGDVEKVFDDAVSALGGLDGVVNNAGIVSNGPAERTSFEDFRRVMDINLNAVFLCSRAAGRIFQESSVRGSIVNTASISAQIIVHPQKQVAYNTSKAGVIGLTRSLAAEWASYGIRVNSVSPGYTRTDLVKSDDLADLYSSWEALIPMGRLAEVGDLTGGFEFLLSDSAAYITGHDLVVDGGYTLW